ncbi:SRPBCC domain-containing protein [Nakamurella leprariae]|uniref:SRPBCC domain-containing protein n=1 Tax=Nakamurella leprariae TaxID=2803911 RepID=A0A938YH35_9ACTN|nr:SRPBCC domain-containing protein [Nakamurella leprariae]MBM9467999.1 SRPBCC domain-containing protein [Nakamurella leprariae]
MNEYIVELADVHRHVSRESSDAGELVRVTLRRPFAAETHDLWHAVTDPDLISRWFMPISGDFREGGHFDLQGNAGGDIEQCDPPRTFRVTFGDASSVVTVTMHELAGDRTELVLDHTVPVTVAGSTAGALYVGPGWDGALVGLARFIDGRAEGDPVQAINSPKMIQFSRQSVALWADAAAMGGASAQEVETARQVALAQFAPDPALGN